MNLNKIKKEQNNLAIYGFTQGFNPYRNKPHVIYYIYDKDYNFLCELVGMVEVKKYLNNLNVQISSNSKKHLIDKKYYVTKECIFTPGII
jgi:hypothetical protein